MQSHYYLTFIYQGKEAPFAQATSTLVKRAVRISKNASRVVLEANPECFFFSFCHLPRPYEKMMFALQVLHTRRFNWHNDRKTVLQ